MPDIHASRRGQDLAATITVTTLAVVFVFLRFVSRGKKGTGLALDDYAILVSLIFLVTGAGLNIALIHYGMGLHSSTLAIENIVTIAKLSMAYECFYCITVGLAKTSLLLMFCRMFSTRGFRLAAFAMGPIVASWALSMVCVSIFRCSPIAKTWDPSISGTCIDMEASFMGNGIPNIVTDIVILLLPTRAVWKLQTTTTHRLSALGILLFGCFVVFTSAYRLASLMEFRHGDTAWTLSKSCTWGVIECSSGIIAACMITLRPLAAMISPTFTRPTSPHRITTDLQASDNKVSSGMAFRPPNELINKPRVHLEVTQLEEESGDEVPFNTIMVRRSMTWQETTG